MTYLFQLPREDFKTASQTEAKLRKLFKDTSFEVGDSFEGQPCVGFMSLNLQETLDKLFICGFGQPKVYKM
jgi:hypothetical protein